MTRKSFSLTELLVVITIFSVLASLLTPSLKDAMSASLRTGCVGHLKSIFVGHVLFSEDNDSRFWGTRGYGYTTYGNNENKTSSWSFEVVEGEPNGQFSHGTGFLEPYIGKKGSDVHFCPDYQRPEKSTYTTTEWDIIKRGDYTSFRDRATSGSVENSMTGGLFRMADYKVSAAWGRAWPSKKFLNQKPHLTYSGYKQMKHGTFVDQYFSYLPFSMDYIPSFNNSSWHFNAGDGQNFYNEGSKVHNGNDLPLLYTDGHVNAKFFFPYLSFGGLGNDLLEEQMIKYMVEDLLQ